MPEYIHKEAAMFALVVSALLSLTDISYEFVPDTDRRVGLSFADEHLVGKLDRNGVFWTDFAYDGEYVAGSPNVIHVRLNPDRLRERPVYEYRNGQLVLGRILKSGHFTPTKGIQPLPFDRYRMGPGAVPIWNLPGYFRPVFAAKN